MALLSSKREISDYLLEKMHGLKKITLKGRAFTYTIIFKAADFF